MNRFVERNEIIFVISLEKKKKRERCKFIHVDRLPNNKT